MSYRLLEGDSRAILGQLPSSSIDAIVTDPPYELGFMGKSWDSTGIAYSVPLWTECLRVLKPGGHMLSFSSPRTYHRMAVAIEDAGFEIRDQLQWIYGQGFPKSKGLLKPAHEPIVLARKGSKGSLQIEASRIGSEGGCRSDKAGAGQRDAKNCYGDGLNSQRSPQVEGLGRWPSNVLIDGSMADQLQDKASYFYCPKASKHDRNEGLTTSNDHPTVKPTELMRYLVKLVTPSGGTILDPFMGSGSTGKAAILEGFSFIGIDLEPENVELAQQRIAHVTQPLAA